MIKVQVVHVGLRYFILLNLLLLMSCQANEKKLNSENDILCIGSDNSKYGAIYLHGTDSVDPSEQEKKNREILQSISKRFDIKVALPRAKDLCDQSKDQLCWGWKFDQDEVNKIQNIIESSSKICKLPSRKILIGFSNGAYALNKLFRLCYLKQDQTIISQGANTLRGPLEYNTRNLSNCGKLIFISGKKDKYNYDTSNSYSKKLVEKSAHVEIVEFEGGHEMDLESLSDAIKSSIQTK